MLLLLVAMRTSQYYGIEQDKIDRARSEISGDKEDTVFQEMRAGTVWTGASLASCCTRLGHNIEIDADIDRIDNSIRRHCLDRLYCLFHNQIFPNKLSIETIDKNRMMV